MSDTHLNKDWNYCFLKNHKGEPHEWDHQFIPHDYDNNDYFGLINLLDTCSPLVPCDQEVDIEFDTRASGFFNYRLRGGFPYRPTKKYSWSFTFNNVVHSISVLDHTRLVQAMKDKMTEAGATFTDVILDLYPAGDAENLEILGTNIQTQTLYNEDISGGNGFKSLFLQEIIEATTVSLVIAGCENRQITWIVNGVESTGLTVDIYQATDTAQAYIVCPDEGCFAFIEFSFGDTGPRGKQISKAEFLKNLKK